MHLHRVFLFIFWKLTEYLNLSGLYVYVPYTACSILSVEGCLLCGGQTPSLDSVTDSAWVNTNSIVWICAPDTTCMVKFRNVPFWVLHKGCQNINLNIVIADCIMNIWLIWFARDVSEHCMLFLLNLAGTTNLFLWSMNALYLWHHGNSCKYSHRSSRSSCCCLANPLSWPRFHK